MKKTENKEYHKNGQLMYQETIMEVPEDLKLYPNSRRRSDGSHFVRIGRNARYHDNGQLNWELNYDDHGNLIKGRKLSYRKDGSIIQYS